MNDRIEIDIEAAIARKKDALLRDYEERARSDAARAERRAKRLEQSLEAVEHFVRRDAERLERILNGDMPPHLICDWLLLDTWSVGEAMLLLAGLEPASVSDRVPRLNRANTWRSTELSGEMSYLVACRTLSGLQLWEDYSAIIPTWERAVSSTLIVRDHFHRRLTAIWESGSHPDRPTPLYCVEWAIRKGFEIGWVHWAAEQGLIEGVAKNGNMPAMDQGTPLEERERTTLLTIIGALSREAGIDIDKPSKAGEVIEKLTEQLGARVSARTIETHIKRIKGAIEKRAK